MVSTMQAIELAQHRGRCRPSPRFGKTGDEHFDASAEDEGFLLVQRRPAAGSDENPEQNAGEP